jgi:hypothetical protein
MGRRYNRNAERSPTEQPRALFTHAALGTLVDVLLSAPENAELQRQVMQELALQRPDKRADYLAQALRRMLDDPAAYGETLYAIVELLATDPGPEATRSMLAILPILARSSLRSRFSPPEDFRAYFYKALATRHRTTDLVAWQAMGDALDGDTLVMILTDPAAVPLRQALKRYRLFDGLPPGLRRQATRTALFRVNPITGLRALAALMTGPPWM